MAEDRHYAVIDPYNRKLTVKYKDQVIAETENAKILKEVGRSVYNPVFYFPKEDLKVELKPEADKSTHCPIKGDASYWNLADPTPNYFAWSYEDPLPKGEKIKGLLAFNENYVTLISEPSGN